MAGTTAATMLDNAARFRLDAPMSKARAASPSGKAIAAFGIAVILAGMLALYYGYSAPSFGAAAMGWLAIIGGTLILLYGISRHMSSAIAPDLAAHGPEGHAEIRLLIQAMAAIAMADRNVADEEVDEFANIHREMLGLAIDPGDVRAILSDFSADTDIVARLSAARAELPPVMRETIFKACYRVMASDHIQHNAEMATLAAIGEALGFYPEQIETMVERLAATHDKE